MGSPKRFAIVELTGGLGNQLFQYAAARALCVREQRRLCFAFHRHRGDTHRSFALNAFRLAPDVSRMPLSLTRLRLLGLRSPLTRRKAGPLWRLLRCRLEQLGESSFAYRPLAARPSRDVVVEGYFQSYRYFADVEDEIRKNLTLVAPPRDQNAALVARMRNENPVCLHVRRGDYVHNPATTAFHGVLGLPYYRDGIDALGPAAEGATYYVFSDEPAWARAHLKLPGPTEYVAHNSVDQPWEDLRLMASCRHFVIANSSLSWWGAYLATAADKRVIAPARWFANPEVDTRDLCPPGWLRM